jgi:hypothetical protein
LVLRNLELFIRTTSASPLTIYNQSGNEEPRTETGLCGCAPAADSRPGEKSGKQVSACASERERWPETTGESEQQLADRKNPTGRRFALCVTTGGQKKPKRKEVTAALDAQREPNAMRENENGAPRQDSERTSQADWRPRRRIQKRGK